MKTRALKQYLVFKLLDLNLALAVGFVKEVLYELKPLFLPGSSDYIEGVINFRGDIIPVLNLKKKFALKVKASEEDMPVLIVSFPFESRELLAGIRVDEVDNVWSFDPDSFTAAPEMGLVIPSDYLEAMVLEDDKMFLFLDLHPVFFSSEDMESDKSFKTSDKKPEDLKGSS